ncbi:MAG: lipoyl(octanoyl) transferase LipB, partial [Actinomycetes bacterium]
MLRVRWIGRVAYREALELQTALFENGTESHLLLLEHPHVFTHGPRAELDKNLKCDPAAVGADFVAVKRGGDITYHGPGQLVGYPILNIDNAIGASQHVCEVEQLVIDTLREIGVAGAGRMEGYAGVWLDVGTERVRKISAIGVRLAHGRTMHGFALNIDPDMTFMREHIVPCGIGEFPVTSLREEGFDVDMKTVVDIVARLAAEKWSDGSGERQDVAWVHRPEDLSRFSRGEGPGEPVRLLGRLADAGVEAGLDITDRKPEWLRPRVNIGEDVLRIKRTLADLDLVTVCEEAGCPNLSECWKDGTATFMVLGERCT